MAILKLQFLLPLMLFSFFGCSQTVQPNPKTTSSVEVVKEEVIESFELGNVQTLELKDFSLDATAKPIQILVFASDTCASCAEEVVHWKKYFSENQPKNVFFAHILLGGNTEDAQDWKDYHEVPWTVLIDEDDSLFRKYCPKIQTPCLLILDRNKGQLQQTYDRLTPNQIQEVTSKWEF